MRSIDIATPSIKLPRRENPRMLDEHSKLRVKELCNRIANEQDQHEFSKLIAELNHLLDPTQNKADGKANIVPPTNNIAPRLKPS
jgi:hypothetical protein